MDRNYRGAIVHKPIRGLHNNVSTYDVGSMYPNIMLGYNLSHETLYHSEQLSHVVTLAHDRGLDVSDLSIPDAADTDSIVVGSRFVLFHSGEEWCISDTRTPSIIKDVYNG